MNPSSHCRASIFEEEFKFQYVRGDIHICIGTQNIILTLLLNVILPGNVNREFCPNIWNRNIF